VLALVLMWVMGSHPERIEALVLLAQRVLPHAFAHACHASLACSVKGWPWHGCRGRCLRRCCGPSCSG